MTSGMARRGVHLAVLVVATLCAQVRSVSIADVLGSVPSCALPCVISGLEAASCSLTDLTLMSDCLCQNTTVLASLSSCTQISCVFSDQILAVGAERSLCAAYPKESKSYQLKVASIITLALSVTVVLARCAARFQTSSRLWIDDWTALLGMVLTAVISSIGIICSLKGFGMHYWDVDVDEGTEILKLFYAVELLYICVQVATKMSIALLFMRVFPARWLQLTTKIFIGFIISHAAIFVMVMAFQCLPVHSIWDRNVTGKCLNVTAVGYAGAAFSILEDILLILLPIPELLKLQVSRRQRINVGIMFAIASFATITSIIRLKFLVIFSNTYDSSWDNVDIFVWSMIEVLCAVVLGSLPPLRPWIARILPDVTVTWSRSTGKYGSTPASGQYQSSRRRSEPGLTARAVPEPSARFSDTTKYPLHSGVYSSPRISKNEWKELDDLPSRPSDDHRPEAPRSVC